LMPLRPQGEQSWNLLSTCKRHWSNNMDLIIDTCKALFIVFLFVLIAGGVITFLVGAFNLTEHEANKPEDREDR